MKILAVMLFCALLATEPVFAREKTDALVMNNGDRLTCEIKGLDAGVLYVGFDYIKGTTQVDWSKVRYLESKQLFLVHAEDGSVYTGTLSTAESGPARPMHIEVIESPEKSSVVEQQKVVTIYETSDSFWRRFNGELNSGLIYSKGNQSTQFSFDAQVQYPRERWAVGAEYDSTLAGSTGANTNTRNNGLAYFRRTLRWNNWFYTGAANLLQSSEQGIDLQSNLGGGVGHFLANNNHTSIALMGGLAFQNTRYSHTVSSQLNQNTAAIFTGANLGLFKFNKTNLTVQATAFPSISEPGRIYSNVDANYYLKFYGDFTWNLSFYGNWDNQPPPHFNGSNYGMSSGFGWTFGVR